MKRVSLYIALFVLLGGGLSAAPQQHQTAQIALTVTSTHAISLTWNASPTPGVTGYILYRSTTSGGPYTRITPPVNALFYVERPGTNGAAENVTYFYVVTATDGTNESAFSNQVSGTMP